MRQRRDSAADLAEIRETRRQEDLSIQIGMDVSNGLREKHVGDTCQETQGDAAAAIGFSITQTGSDGKEKVRRGDDWRRGKQNLTARVWDRPSHHILEVVLAGIAFLTSLGIWSISAYGSMITRERTGSSLCSTCQSRFGFW